MRRYLWCGETLSPQAAASPVSADMKTGATFYLFNKNFLVEFDSSVICEIKDLEERGPGQKFLFRSSCTKASSFLLPVCRGIDTLYLKGESASEKRRKILTSLPGSLQLQLPGGERTLYCRPYSPLYKNGLLREAEVLSISKKAFGIHFYFSSGPCQSAFGSLEQAELNIWTHDSFLALRHGLCHRDSYLWAYWLCVSPILRPFCVHWNGTSDLDIFNNGLYLLPKDFFWYCDGQVINTKVYPVTTGTSVTTAYTETLSLSLAWKYERVI
ncbi:hypothetical protein STEG23_017641 [Scotinomys teguina]